MQFDNILWCNEDNHDKIWGSFTVEGSEYVFWGRRGAKMQFKYHGAKRPFYPNYPTYRSKVEKLVAQKKEKGYNDIDAIHMFTLFPSFEDDVEAYLLIAKLEGKVR